MQLLLRGADDKHVLTVTKNNYFTALYFRHPVHHEVSNRQQMAQVHKDYYERNLILTEKAMNFLEEIKSFCKGKLQSVETKVRTPDGRELVESKDSSGVVSVRLCPGQGLGFVEDVKPDLQVATIIPGLSLGSQDVAHEFALLKRSGVTHILNLATGIPNSFEGSFHYKRINIFDLPDVNIRGIFEECFLFIICALKDGGHVFVHCNQGISRSATVVIAYLMKHHKMSYIGALICVKQIRPVIRPNEGFVKQLMDYEQELFEKEVDAGCHL